MNSTILITGATDGIGLETAKLLRAQGHNLLLHGRSDAKLTVAKQAVMAIGGQGQVATINADLSSIAATQQMAQEILADGTKIDVLINNAGVFAMADPRTSDGLDARFVVNVIAPYILATELAPSLGRTGRIVNLSSAAQAPVSLSVLAGKKCLSDNDAYAQSKLALTMWSRHLADELGDAGPMVVAVNPGSLLGSKMVKEAYGMQGKDLSIGAKILARAATSEEFASASGRYFDNDGGQFRNPHPDALDPTKNAALVEKIEGIVSAHGQ
ncbi:MAG: SDR family NAD(P)-dependent oxidoreductase [Erythrobacter sp.]|nr:SDR family NAD(P)-dependent oxidoreductase [Erythrobacter sp.]NNC53367.1 SDR family NAD(P)-dependent oxidoreductase [Erythrobacter sp.]